MVAGKRNGNLNPKPPPGPRLRGAGPGDRQAVGQEHYSSSGRAMSAAGLWRYRRAMAAAPP